MPYAILHLSEKALVPTLLELRKLLLYDVRCRSSPNEAIHGSITQIREFITTMCSNMGILVRW